MMNNKQFFYRDYFKAINLEKSINEDEQKAINERNKKAAPKANQRLAEFRFFPQYAKSTLGWHAMPEQRELVTTYPGLLIGSGYLHETKSTSELTLGFFFDHTTGLPIIPGSSIKGRIRSLFPGFRKSAKNTLQPEAVASDSESAAKAEMIAQLFGLPNDHQLLHQLELSIFEGVDILASLHQMDAGDQPAYLPKRQRDVFLDAYPTRTFLKNNQLLGLDTITPHGDNPLKSPTPLPFLKVMPGVTFTFPWQLQDTTLNKDTVVTASTKAEAFLQLIEWVGLGAKTNVGYGQFIRPEEWTYGNHADSEPTEEYEQVALPVATRMITTTTTETPLASDLQVGTSVQATVEKKDLRKMQLILHILGTGDRISKMVNFAQLQQYQEGQTITVTIKKLQGRSIKSVNL